MVDLLVAAEKRLLAQSGRLRIVRFVGSVSDLKQLLANSKGV